MPWFRFCQFLELAYGAPSEYDIQSPVAEAEAAITRMAEWRARHGKTRINGSY